MGRWNQKRRLFLPWTMYGTWTPFPKTTTQTAVPNPSLSKPRKSTRYSSLLLFGRIARPMLKLLPDKGRESTVEHCLDSEPHPQTHVALLSTSWWKVESNCLPRVACGKVDSLLLSFVCWNFEIFSSKRWKWQIRVCRNGTARIFKQKCCIATLASMLTCSSKGAKSIKCKEKGDESRDNCIMQS